MCVHKCVFSLNTAYVKLFQAVQRSFRYDPLEVDSHAEAHTLASSSLSSKGLRGTFPPC